MTISEVSIYRLRHLLNSNTKILDNERQLIQDEVENLLSDFFSLSQNGLTVDITTESHGYSICITAKAIDVKNSLIT